MGVSTKSIPNITYQKGFFRQRGNPFFLFQHVNSVIYILTFLLIFYKLAQPVFLRSVCNFQESTSIAVVMSISIEKSAVKYSGLNRDVEKSPEFTEAPTGACWPMCKLRKLQPELVGRSVNYGSFNRRPADHL